MTSWLKRIKCNPFCAVAIVLTIIAIWQAFSPKHQNYAGIKETKIELVTLGSKDLVNLIKSPETKRTLLYIYASWCPTCHLLGAKWMERAQKGEMKKSNVIFLSIDKSRAEMIRYFANHGYHRFFKPYIADEKPELIFSFLASGGAVVENKLPATFIIDNEGYIHQEVYGIPSDGVIDKMLRDVSASP